MKRWMTSLLIGIILGAALTAWVGSRHWQTYPDSTPSAPVAPSRPIPEPQVALGSPQRPAPEAAPPAPSPSASGDLRMTPVVMAVRKASPSVVNISTEQVLRARVHPFGSFLEDPFFERFFQDFFEPYYREYRTQSLGSGFIIHPQGFIVTNYHVIERGTTIIVRLVDRREFRARVVGTDAEHDIAVLRVETPQTLPVADIGTSADLMVGEPVIAIGNPFGLSHTVTTGVISALHRSVRTPERVYNDFIQTDAPINPGNSGGPLLNIYGKVIGVNTAIRADAQGIGFAIPIDLVMRVVRDLVAFGRIRQTWWGFRLEENLRPRGLVVTYLYPGGPAEAAGIRLQDVIVRVEGQPTETLEDFYRIWESLPPDRDVTVEVLRGTQTQTLRVRLRTLTASQAVDIIDRLMGLRGVLIDSQVRRRYRVPLEYGWLLTEVRPESPAAAIGFRAGDVVVQINDQVLNSEEALVRSAISLFQVVRAAVQVYRAPYVYSVEVPLLAPPAGRRRAAG